MQLAQSYLQGQGSPFDGVFEAYGQGQTLRQNNDLLKAQQAEQARKLQAQQQLEQLDWNDQNAIAQVVAQFPEYTAGAKEYYANMQADEQKAYLADSSKYISAMDSGRPDIAVNDLRDKATRYNDMGMTDKADELSELAEWIAKDPQSARKAIAMGFAANAPKDFSANYSGLVDADIAQDDAPIDRAKTVAETGKLGSETINIDTLTPLQAKKLEAEEVDTLAGAKQKIANAGEADARTNRIGELLPYEQASMESSASLNQANAGLAATRATDIPIARADAQAQQAVSNQLAQLKLQLQSESNSVARDRLQVQIDKLEHTKAAYAAGLSTKQIETNQKNQKRLAAYDKGIEGINQTRSTITRLLNNKSGLKGAAGALQGRMPSVRKDTLQFEKDLETLQSQVFLTQVEKMRGLGALTDFEGKKLESGIANLSLVQSEEALARNLAIVYDAMASFEKAAQTEYKDLLGEVSTNQTGSTAGRSYMQYAN